MSSAPERTAAYRAWLLPAGTLFLMCGILIGRGSVSWAPAAAASTCALAALLFSRRWLRTTAAMLLALSLGAILGWHGYHPVLPAEGDCVVQATVADEIELGRDGHVQTLLTDVRLNGQSAPDAYWTYYLDEDESLPEWLRPGAQLEMTSRVYHPSGKTNPGGFDFREYLLQRGVKIGLYGAEEMVPVDAGFSLAGTMAALRHDLSLRLMEVMGEEAGAYAAAMLLGTKDFIPSGDKEAFRDLGIAHILSVSGFHVGVLAALMALLLRPVPLGRKGRTALEGSVLLAYCMLTGGNAPVIRASAMLLWREYTRIRHRQNLPLHLMCVTAVAQLFFAPTLLTGASFQLTYGAMLGLLLIYPWLKNRITLKSPAGQKLWETFCAALSAQIGILAPQLYWFGELPLLSVVLNMAVIPLSSGLISLYWATLLLMPVPLLRDVLGMLSAGATKLLLETVRWMADHAFITLWTRHADGLVWLGSGLLIWGLSHFVPRCLTKARSWLILLGVLLTLTILIPLPEKDVTYIQFDVGNADAAVLQDKDVTVVIDTGDLDQTVASYLHQRRQSVELLILTHLHIDHAGGLNAILEEGIPVEVCCLPVDAELPVIDEEALLLVQCLAETGTELRFLHRGDVIGLPSGTLRVLWPEATRISALHDANDVCLVLQADIAGVTMLLTGDLSGTYEHYIQTPVDILKVAHHGSSASTSPEFLAAVDPQLLLLSNSDARREARMVELAGDIPLYSTEECGAVTITFLGEGAFMAERFLSDD